MLDYEAGHRDPETTYFSSKIFAEKGESHSYTLVFAKLTPRKQPSGSLFRTTRDRFLGTSQS
jgi:hypothetical protein